MLREEAIEILNRDDDEMRKGYFCINDFLAIETLKQEPKTGHWVNDNHGHIVCSSCNETNVTIWKSKYCPCCGARMSEVKND